MRNIYKALKIIIINIIVTIIAAGKSHNPKIAEAEAEMSEGAS